jgi:hypothetical protein
MYGDLPYARAVGHVGEAAGVATEAGVTEGHDVPPAVLAGVLHWVRKGCVAGQDDPGDVLEEFRREALVGSKYCRNETCDVVGQLKDFKVCPQCKTARYWATRVRKRTGLRVDTRKVVVHSHISPEKVRVSAPSKACYIATKRTKMNLHAQL